MREFDGVEMALVPAGCFMMGSEDGHRDEQPIHEVCFDEPFWIDVYEVTNEQHGSSGEWSGDNLPRESVDWFEAAAHCESRGARLPTEAEWEYAARGPDGLIFPWGDAFDCRLGNFDDETRHTSWVLEGAKGCDGYVETAPVGSFPDGASWVGALDMSGNVLEWLADWHDDDYYERSPRDNPGGPENGEFRVMRGGSWLDFDEDFVRGALRRSALPVGVADYYGIRCALSYD
jgi:formylglycine-generating enzyme required for sulfatase activity